MKHISAFIVKHHKPILIFFTLLAIAGGFLMFQVNINADMTEYLPESSPAKQGVQILSDEFPAASSFTLMFKDLADARKADVLTQVQAVEGVQQAVWNDTQRYNHDGYTLYEVTISQKAGSDAAKATIDQIVALFPDDAVTASGDAAGNTVLGTITTLLIVAGALLLLVLFIMCTSWIEPLLFLITLGIAIFLNMGSNIIFPSVSQITFSIASILQVCLSIDYSVMLLSRYRQEKEEGHDKREAMRRALTNGFSSISASSLTTIVGMLALTLMSFTIGMDMGLVLAKGVFFSLLCIFTVLPALILLFDGLMDKTMKKAFLPRMTKIGAFEHKARYALLIVFVLLLVGSFFLRNNVNITYSLSDYYEVNKHFAVSNPLVVVYDNKDEAAIAPEIAALAADERVDSVTAYETVMSTAYDANTFAQVSGMNPAMVQQLYAGYGAQSIPLKDLIPYLQKVLQQNPSYQSMLPENAMEQLAGLGAMFTGETHSRAIINTTLPVEGADTFAFLADVHRQLDKAGVDYLLVGNSAIAYEMHNSFPGEMNRITILTVLAIFLIVAVVFRKLTVPLLLTLSIQCAVWITMGTSYLQGISMYYLPLLIVQCLLLGAMVDYGILYADYYHHLRQKNDKKNSIILALRNSIHTILTSGLVLISVTTGVGLLYAAIEPSISEILLTIAKGGAIAVLLVVFVLPGVLAALDRKPEPAKALEPRQDKE